VSTPTPSRPQRLSFHVLDVAFNITVILLMVGVIRTFLVSPFQVEGNSMVSTLENGEYIIINKLAYYLHAPERGDVVVFRPPSDPDKYYVKRVIGLPGDAITIEGGEVYVRAAGAENNTELDEEYLDTRNREKTFRHPPAKGDPSTVRYEVPADHYFLLGDNRQGSLDSRSFMVQNSPAPYVPQNEIKGKVWFIALPITKIHALDAPTYALP
jgi:signal peptidase I